MANLNDLLRGTQNETGHAFPRILAEKSAWTGCDGLPIGDHWEMWTECRRGSGPSQEMQQGFQDSGCVAVSHGVDVPSAAVETTAIPNPFPAIAPGGPPKHPTAVEGCGEAAVVEGNVRVIPSRLVSDDGLDRGGCRAGFGR